MCPGMDVSTNLAARPPGVLHAVRYRGPPRARATGRAAAARRPAAAGRLTGPRASARARPGRARAAARPTRRAASGRATPVQLTSDHVRECYSQSSRARRSPVSRLSTRWCTPPHLSQGLQSTEQLLQRAGAEDACRRRLPRREQRVRRSGSARCHGSGSLLATPARRWFLEHHVVPNTTTRRHAPLRGRTRRALMPRQHSYAAQSRWRVCT